MKYAIINKVALNELFQIAMAMIDRGDKWALLNS